MRVLYHRGMRMRLYVLLFAVTTACSDSKGPALPDADLTKPMCTKQLYDSCLNNEGCASGMCKLFEQDAIQVCTQECNMGMCPAPIGGGTDSCNNRGICKPSVANPCHP